MASDVSLAEEGEEQTRPGCPTPVETQVESLRALAPGWYDESSPAYDASSLTWLGKHAQLAAAFGLDELLAKTAGERALIRCLSRPSSSS